jgi:pentatricopeptide repeat protein
MREMQERGIRPTVVTFSLLIKSFGAEGKHERAEEVFRSFEPSAFDP